MTETHFRNQVHRLESQFGKYGAERGGILWKEVKTFSDHWFTKVVDKMLSSSRHMPLPSDFAFDISEERERVWRLEKKQHAQDAKDFWSGTYHPDEVKDICQKIRLRIQGRMSDEDWKPFLKALQYAAERNEHEHKNNDKD